MKAAVYNGMMTEGIEPLSAVCPTGNCTWPLTPSLAVCGGCHNSSFTIKCEGSICNYTMPSGSVAQLTNDVYDGEGAGFQVLGGTGAYYNVSLNDKAYIANFDMLGAPYDSYATTWSNDSLVCSECALWMCIQTYNVTTVSAAQVQTVVSTFSNYNRSLLLQGGNGGEVLPWPAMPSDVHASADTNFTIGLFAIDALSEYLSGVINGTVYLNLETQAPTSDATEAVWNGTQNLDVWIDNLALSMSNVVRTGASVSRAAYNGTAYQPGITVRWAWLALPVAMVVFSLIFLILIMVRTVRSPVEAWKGSPLAFLLFDVDQDTKNSIHGHTQRYRGIEESIGEKRAVLTGHRGGTWKFQTD